MKTRLRKALSVSTKLALTVGLFILLFRPHTFGLSPTLFGGVTPRRMFEEIADLDPGVVFFWLAMATTCRLAGIAAGILRWRRVLAGQGLYIPWIYLLQSWFVGRFFGLFLPGAIGFDAYRFYDSARYTGAALKSGTVVLVEKLIGTIALTLLMFATFPITFYLLDDVPIWLLTVTWMGIGLFLAGSFSLLLVPRRFQAFVMWFRIPRSIRMKQERLGEAVADFHGKSRLLISAFGWGLLFHLSTISMYFCAMMAVREGVFHFWNTVVALPVLVYGTVLGPSIGGEAVRDIMYAVMLGETSGGVIAVLYAQMGWWAGEVVPFIIGAPFFLLQKRIHRYSIKVEQRRDARISSPSLSKQETPDEKQDVGMHCKRLG